MNYQLSSNFRGTFYISIPTHSKYTHAMILCAHTEQSSTRQPKNIQDIGVRDAMMIDDERDGIRMEHVKWSKINIETRRSTTLEKRVILVQGPC